MSHLLGKMLNSNGPFFDRLIDDLEKATGQNFADVDLIGQILTEVNAKMRQLNLEPGNTLPEEIKQALLAKYVTNNQQLEYQLFGDQVQTVDQRNLTLIETLNSFDLPQYLRLSDRFIVRLLSENKPKIFLSKMGLQSIDQAFKSFDFEQILFVCLNLESKAWQERVKEYLKKYLKRGYMELKTIKFTTLDRRLLVLLDSKELLIINQLLSSIFVNQTQIKQQQPLETVVKALIKTQNKVDVLNKFYLFRISSDFSVAFDHWYQPKQNYVWRLLDNPVPWRGMNRNFANKNSLINQKLTNDEAKKLVDFDPYCLLSQKFSSLSFWKNSKNLAYHYQNQVISFNLFDMVQRSQQPESTFNHNYYFQQELWQSLIAQYLSNQMLAERVIKQLRNKLIRKDNL